MTTPQARPWPALWALCLGFFMILVDTTIVAVAIPSIMTGLDATVNQTIWVNSSYLLAYAVPLLITGRLGDRYGPKQIYLIGLAVFTVTSLWCGLSPTIAALITARVFQGLGASLMTPQTMAVITRLFPPDRRGTPMGVWGAVAGMATLTGPIMGGVLVDAFSWEWIFYVNVPIGVIALVVAWRLVPTLPIHSHTFDIPGVMLSGAGMFLIVFGVQQGESHGWGAINGIFSIPLLIAGGVALMIIFVIWQAKSRGEPLVPLNLFSDRNFALSNITIATVGFTISAMALPLMLFAQIVRGLSPTRAALIIVPMAVASGLLAPLVGRLIDRVNPKYVVLIGLCLFSAGMFWLGSQLKPDVALWHILLPVALMGIGQAGVWAPLSTTVTRNLSMDNAGAGSGVFNTTRQFGAVIGSAAIAAMMEARITANLPAAAGDQGSAQQAGMSELPDFLHEPFALAMGQSTYLPAALLIVGIIAVLFLEPPRRAAQDATSTAAAEAASDQQVKQTLG